MHGNNLTFTYFLELGYIIDSSPSQYVPDVIYKEKDDYGNEVTKNSRYSSVYYFYTW